MLHEVIHMPIPHTQPIMERLVFSGIVFNMSWEDPEMDRRAFNIRPGRDAVVSITSAGCNPLNFLAQDCEKLYSVDGNPAQNAILELKLAAIENLDYEDFFGIFSAQNPGILSRVYRPFLRPHISHTSQKFWDRNLWLAARNIYTAGKMGLFCRILRLVLDLVGIPAARREEFFELRSLEEQQAYYQRYVEPKLWGPMVARLIRFRPFMYLAGVHPEQFDLVHHRHDMYAYVRERIEYALTKVPIYDNYFLSAAVTGKMRGKRVPPYLLEENFATLRRGLSRVTVVNGWLGPYLDTLPPDSIDKFNLLDIFDWMIGHRPQMFEDTLRSALRVARPDATMIYRSGSYRLDPPAAVQPYLEPNEALARELLAIDRSATYGSFYIFRVKSRPGDESPPAGKSIGVQDEGAGAVARASASEAIRA